MSALNTELLPIEEKLLYTPSLEEISASKCLFFMSYKCKYLMSHLVSSIGWVEK